MAQKTVAVTGAAGIVGTRVVQHMLRAGYQVHALVRSQPPVGHPLFAENVTLTTLDLATATEQSIVNWLDVTRPRALIHGAAWVDVRGCERQPELATTLNTDVTKMFARACARYHTQFVMISTDYVFDGTYPPGTLYLEDDRPQPANQYGRSKLLGELATQEACADKTLWTICRTAVVYGSAPGSRSDFVQWLRMQLGHNQPVSIAQDLVSSPTHAVDLAKMLATIVEHRLAGVYHTAGSTSMDRYHFALKIAQRYNLDQTLIHPTLASELGSPLPLNVGLCVDKISRDAGLRPLSVEEGLAYCRELEKVEG